MSEDGELGRRRTEHSAVDPAISETGDSTETKDRDPQRASLSLGLHSTAGDRQGTSK